MKERKRYFALMDCDPCGSCKYAPGWFETLLPLAIAFVLGGAFTFYFFGG